MNTWQAVRRSTILALAGAAVVVGPSLTSTPASAQDTIACVSNRLGLVRIVDDELDCKPWEHAQTIGGGDGSGVKFVFVTSATYTGDLVQEANNLGLGPFDVTQGAEAGDAICNHHAGSVFLPGTYLAWLSDSAVDARSRMPDPGGPWFNVNGQLVAASLQGLINTASVDLYNPILFTELGAEVGAPGNTWTGTDDVGQVGLSTCENWTADFSAFNGLQGLPTTSTTTWTEELDNTCDDSAHVYCFQM